MAEEVTKMSAEEIKNKFKKKPSDDSRVKDIIGNSESYEKQYSDVGQERAEQTRNSQEKHEQAKVVYKQTSLRVLLKDIIRFRNQESRFLLENELLTYEKVFCLGIDFLEKMSDTELHELIESNKKT